MAVAVAIGTTVAMGNAAVTIGTLTAIMLPAAAPGGQVTVIGPVAVSIVNCMPGATPDGIITSMVDMTRGTKLPRVLLTWLADGSPQDV